MVDAQVRDPAADRPDVPGVAGNQSVDSHEDPRSGASVFQLRDHRSKVALFTTSTMCEL
jgi:hypothetical protein